MRSVFTKILDGDIKAAILNKTDRTFSILDNRPLTKGHSLVISKDQVDHIDDCDKDTYLEMFDEVRKLSKVMKEKLKPKRVAIVVHGFEVPHAHIHVVPLYKGNEIKLAAKDREDLTNVDEQKLVDILKL